VEHLDGHVVRVSEGGTTQHGQVGLFLFFIFLFSETFHYGHAVIKELSVIFSKH
jgi:hypothetical protein